MLEFHRLIMGDKVRNKAFEAALKRVIVPGKTILADVGSGTGFLGFMAEKLGAKKCYLIESGDIQKLSKKIAQKNHLERCQFIAGHSTQVKLPELVDVVVSETLGNFAYEEHILETLSDAKRFLKPTGVMIPQKIRQYMCPVTSDRLWKEINIWKSVEGGLDFSPAEEATVNNIFVRTIEKSDLLQGTKASQLWDEVDLTKKPASIRNGKIQWHIEKPVTVYGAAMFWECDLIPGITLSTNPDDPKTHWEQIYAPVLSPIPLERGETLEIAVTSDTRPHVGVNVTWSYSVKDSKGKVRLDQKLDMRKGLL